MKPRLPHLIAALALLAVTTLNSQLSTCRAQGTAFTYQGQLQNNGGPANGSYDLTFTLFNVSSGGVGSFGPLTNSAVAVTNGLFTTTLDFGSGVFDSGNWWLQIGVRTNGSASFAPLTPREQLTPMPYAIYSTGAGTAAAATTATTANGVAAGSVTGAGIASGQVVKSLNGLTDAVTLSAGANVTITPSGNTLTVASIGGGGSGWSLTGNAGTTPGTDFLGTSDDEPLELWVNDGRAFRLEPGNGSANVVGGSGSSADSSVNGGTIAGGIQNTLSNLYPTVSGGEYNHATANGAVVGGGYNNTASGREATVGGGAQNLASGAGAFVGGGGYDGTTLSHNAADGPAATVVGGLQNFASAYATVGGGSTNTANGLNSTVPGGYFNEALGSYSFAAGFGAEAQHDGSFVWADDSGGGFFSSTANNQFSVRAEGGVRFVTGGVGMTVDGVPVGGSINGNTASGSQALNAITFGRDNTADGFQALLSCTNGEENTAIGTGALYYNTTGSFNISLGYLAGKYTTGDNNIDIGNLGASSENGTIRIGSYGDQTNTFISGIFGATAASGVPVYVNTSGQLGTLTSSARFKQNIQSMNEASDVLLSLHPVTFQYKPEIDPRGIPQFGLVAEEVEKVDPNLVARDDKGQIYTVRYEAVNAMLLNEFLKEHHKIAEQNTQIQDLMQSVAELKQMLQSLAEKK